MLQLALTYTASPSRGHRQRQTSFTRTSFRDVRAVLDYLDRSEQAFARHIATEICLGHRAGLIEEEGASLVWMLKPTQRHRN